MYIYIYIYTYIYICVCVCMSIYMSMSIYTPPATQVNYVAKGARIYSPGEPVPGAASVVARYLRTAYLWDAVRVQGGAYGCGLSFDRTSGTAVYSSYRDPNVLATLDAYDGTAAFLRRTEINDAELSKAIIGAVGDLDSPQAVNAKGFTSMLRWMVNLSEEDRQEWRSQVYGIYVYRYRYRCI